MFANSSLIENSVINLDMLYKYVFSSYTPSYGISSTAYTPYSPALRTEINNAVYTDEIYQVPNREGGLLEGFTWHPGDDTAMDTEYDDPTSNNGEYAGIKVQDSIALNPYILFGGVEIKGGVETPVPIHISATTTYTITFTDESSVDVYIYLEMSTGPDEDYSVLDGTIKIFFSDGYNMEQVKAMGEVYSISLADRTIDVDQPGYACTIRGVAEEYGRFCLKRGSLIWRKIIEDEVSDFYVDDWVSETDIVNTNFSGMSQYNIEACIYEETSYYVYLDVIPTAMTWTDTIKTIDNSNAVSASEFTAILYGNNGFAKVNRTDETLSVGENSTTSYGDFSKTSDNEIPYTVEWSRNSGPYYLMTSSVTMNGNNVVSVAEVGLEYDLILFTYSDYQFGVLNSYHTINVKNKRTNQEVSLLGSFVNNYGPQATIKFVDGDTLEVKIGQDEFGMDEIEVDGGYLTGSTIQTFNYVATVTTKGVSGVGDNFETPPIDGTNHFNNNRARAAIRLNITVH